MKRGRVWGTGLVQVFVLTVIPVSRHLFQGPMCIGLYIYISPCHILISPFCHGAFSVMIA